MSETENEVSRKARAAKDALGSLFRTTSTVRAQALLSMSKELWDNRQKILDENRRDVREFQASGGSDAIGDRLMLNEKRLREACDGLRHVASLPDLMGEIVEGWRTRAGLDIRKIRVPLGVIGVIYEARPNVTIDIAGLMIKSCNAVVLRGGSESLNTNTTIVEAMRKGLESTLDPECIQLIESKDRKCVEQMLHADGLIDVIVPRGGSSLINYVKQTSKVPVIETGAGNCHIFVNRDADFGMANRIIVNAKTQRPSVCNAVRKVLVHTGIASQYIPLLVDEMRRHSVIVKGCERARAVVAGMQEATEGDWYEEYMDLTLAIKVTDSVEDAVNHINKYSTRHSEAIITNNIGDANYFTTNVDSACVYVNASTRFTDGYEFGFGAEVGISTQKLHARGPMGLRELTTTKYIIWGEGQIRD